MTSALTIWNAVFLAAIAQGILLALFLLANKTGNRKANIFLASLILVYSVDIGLETLYSSPLIFDYPHFIGFNDALFFLYGPLLYLYAYFLCMSLAVSDEKWLFHFLPFLLIVVLYIPTLYVQSAEFKLSSEGKLPPLPLASGPSSFIDAEVRGHIELTSAFHELVYIVLTLFLMRKHERTIKDSFSTIDRINLRWLKNLTFATGVIVAVDILLYFFVDAEFLAYEKAVTLILFLCAVLIYAVGYMGLKQPTIFSPIAIAGNNPSAAVNDGSREKYYKSTLTDQQAENTLAKLLELMETRKSYLNGDLTLTHVAEALSISNNGLSQIINDKLHRNFYDFINAYRVEAAKTLIADPDKKHLTLLAVAYEVGFKSKSTFNSVFKKHCKMTPSQFKKSIGNETS